MFRVTYRILLLVVFFSFLWVPAAPAEMKLFPMWHRYTCGIEQSQFACYTFDETKEIMKLDLDLQLKLQELETLEVDKSLLETAYDKLEEANSLTEEANKRLEARLTEKQRALEETTVDLKKADEYHVLKYLPWIIAGGVILAGVGFGVGFYCGIGG